MKKIFIGVIAVLTIASVCGVNTAVTYAADCTLNRGPYKTSYSSTVYLVSESCTKTAINSEEKYFSYFTSWNDTQTVDATTLAGIPNSPLGFLPWGSLRVAKNGDLEKIARDGANGVYLRVNDTWYGIDSGDTFAAYGFQWNWITDMADSSSTYYRFSNPRADRVKRGVNMGWLPLGMVVKVEGSTKLYVLENQNGQKTWRHIPTMEEFRAMNFREDRIPTVSQTAWNTFMQEDSSQLYCQRGQSQTTWTSVQVPWWQDYIMGGTYTETRISVEGDTCP